MNVPPDHIRQRLSYSPETGEFYWLDRQPVRLADGAQAGSIMNNGYRSIMFEGKRYLAHRLAWWFSEGWLPAELDHMNGDRADNRLANLRPATTMQNRQNRSTNGWGASAFKGVSRGRGDYPWRAVIVIAGKQRHLGYMMDEEDAARAYDAAARQHFGEYARCNYEEER